MDNKDNDKQIPDFPNAEEGLMGVKAPNSWRQTDDIRDRLQAGGVLRTLGPVYDARAQGAEAEVPVVRKQQDGGAKPKFVRRID